MKTNIKIQDLFRLNSGLKSIPDLKGNSGDRGKFPYAISRNIEIIKMKLSEERIEITVEGKYIQAYSKDYEKYDLARIELCVKHSKKDVLNAPVLKEDGGFDIAEKNQKKFDKEIAELQKNHAEAIKAQKADDEAFKKLFEDNEEIEINLYKLKVDFIPDEIKVSELHSIKEILIDTVEKVGPQ